MFSWRLSYAINNLVEFLKPKWQRAAITRIAICGMSRRRQPIVHNSFLLLVTSKQQQDPLWNEKRPVEKVNVKELA